MESNPRIQPRSHSAALSLQPDARPPSGTPSRPSSGKPRWCSAVGARSMIRLVVVTTLPAENRLPTAINVGCVSYGPSPPSFRNRAVRASCVLGEANRHRREPRNAIAIAALRLRHINSENVGGWNLTKLGEVFAFDDASCPGPLVEPVGYLHTPRQGRRRQTMTADDP